jgi:hypothetical protein
MADRGGRREGELAKDAIPDICAEEEDEDEDEEEEEKEEEEEYLFFSQ